MEGLAFHAAQGKARDQRVCQEEGNNRDTDEHGSSSAEAPFRRHVRLELCEAEGQGEHLLILQNLRRLRILARSRWLRTRVEP